VFDLQGVAAEGYIYMYINVMHPFEYYEDIYKYVPINTKSGGGGGASKNMAGD
jgi:hypothetical protein